MSFNLRLYQSSAIEGLRAELGNGKKRVVLYSPTGSGKTEIGMEMIRLALGKGKRVAFLVNRIELCVQASRRFHKAGIEHGVIQGDNTINISAPVIIGSIFTVARRSMPDVDLILIDEAHAVPGSKAFRDLLFKLNNVPVIGLTATPFSTGMGKAYRELGGRPLFEELVTAATIRELIDMKFLVDVEVYAPSEPDLRGVKIVAGDYNEKQLGEAVDKPALVGDIVAHWIRLAKGTATVVFATNQAHSRHIVEEFKAVGVAAEHVDCFTADDERQAILARVRTGQTTVISNVGILAEGWDHPACSTMVLARPTRSLCRYIQMSGRILRPFPGKERGLILDHSGTVARLGFPTDDLPLDLDDGKPKSAGKQKAERRESLPKPCPSCKFVRAAGVHACPKCGFKPERQSDVETIDGELVKVDRKRPVTKDTKQHVFSQLLFIQRNRGYRQGWAANQYRTIFEVWPRGLAEVTATPTQEILNKVRANQIAYAKRKGGDHAAA